MEKLFKLLRGKHWKGGKFYQAGENVPLTDEEFAAFENKFEPVATPAPAPAETPAPNKSGKGKTAKGKVVEPDPETEGNENGDPGMGEGGE